MATVLVIDDDAYTRLLVRTVLAHAGHTVIEAVDSNEALMKAVQARPDLILLDLSLPAMSGPQLARALRADPVTRGMKVALYTASPMNAALRDFMEMYEIAQVIAKPSEPAELLAGIERALGV